MTRAAANQILRLVRAGIDVSPKTVDKALAATGDLAPFDRLMNPVPYAVICPISRKEEAT